MQLFVNYLHFVLNLLFDSESVQCNGKSRNRKFSDKAFGNWWVQDHSTEVSSWKRILINFSCTLIVEYGYEPTILRIISWLMLMCCVQTID